MKDLIILSDTPITYESLSPLLKKEFKKYKILNDSKEYIYMKGKYSSFEIEFTPFDQLSNPECMMDETVELCPNKNAYLTNLSYSSLTIAKRIITLISNLYGNIWTQNDENDNWFGTGKEFLEDYTYPQNQ